MNRYTLTIIGILSSIFVMTNEANACINELPTAVINDYDKFQTIGIYEGTTYDGKIAYYQDGGSHDNDELGEAPDITAYEWHRYEWNGYDWVDTNQSVGGSGNGFFIDLPGFYQIRLSVRDNDDPDPENPPDLYWFNNGPCCNITVYQTVMNDTYVPYGTCTNLGYSILPDTPLLFWTTGSYIGLAMFNSQNQEVFELIDYYPYAQTGNDLFFGTDKTYTWDGKGNYNNGPYNGEYLAAGQYGIILETGKKNYYGPGEYDYDWGWHNVLRTLTVFDAQTSPQYNYIAYGTGMNLNYDIRPHDGWYADGVYIKIWDTEDNVAFIFEDHDIYVGLECAYEWDGKGNEGDYSGDPLPPGTYYVSIEVKKEDLWYETPYYSCPEFTVAEVKAYIDDSKTNILEDWPEESGLLRSPMYIFGQNNPIYVEVRGLGTDPSQIETKQDAVKVTSESDPDNGVKLTLIETGANTNIFHNINVVPINELLYLSTESAGTSSGDKIKVVDEEVLTFSLRNNPSSSEYTESYTVKVDRAEVGTEYQDHYSSIGHHVSLSDIPSYKFGEQLYNNIGGSSYAIWHRNFKNSDLDSKKFHWQWEYDEAYTDSVDLVSWSGHNEGGEFAFFKDTSGNLDLLNLADYEVHLGDTDAEWVIFDTCWSLKCHSSIETPPNPSAILNALKNCLLNASQYYPSIRNAHMFLGFKGSSWHEEEEHGKYFTDQMKDYTIKDSWIRYIENTQPATTTGRIFYAVDCQNDYFGIPNYPGFAARSKIRRYMDIY